MNKTELVSKMAETGISKKAAAAALDAAIEAVTAAVAAGDKVQLTGFGTFECKERAARTGVNPSTGAKIEIAASKAPSFKAGAAFKAAVNK